MSGMDAPHPPRRRRRLRTGLGALLAAVAWTPDAGATERHVRYSTPAAEAIIQGRHAEYVIRFDGPVDHAASKIEVTQSGHVVQSLAPRLDSAVDVLFASGEAPAPGRYQLHWETTAPDGEVSRGDIPFSVAP
jgi:methionine-rich copper-binding protein CopC